MKSFFGIVCLAVSLFSNPVHAMKDDVLSRLKANTNFEDVSSLKNLRLEIRYATKDNFLHKPIYGEYRSCFLHKEAAAKFKKAIVNLQTSNPGYQFLVFDCLRPRSIQRLMWKAVKGKPEQKYVGDPKSGSVHNFGFAIDLSLLDANGKEVDMGTPYDFFGPLAEVDREGEFLRTGQLTETQIKNRKILRDAMVGAGFIQLPHEWWHYDASDKKRARW